MPTNNPRVVPAVRAPRLQILLDGRPLPGAVEASWTQNNHYAADTFSAQFAANADPRYGPKWWDNRTDPMVLDVQVGMVQPGGAVQWTSLGIGQVDAHTMHPTTGLIEVEGRDLSILMLEQPTAETFQNQTVAQVVQTIAGRHGLVADVGPATDLAMRYWQIDHTTESSAQHAEATNEWDLLIRLARAEGYDCYVTGRTLHFQPVTAMTVDPYVLRFQPAAATARSPVSNGIELSLRRNFSLAKSVTVIVKSFHSKAGKAVTATKTFGAAPTGGSVAGSVYLKAGKHTQRYVFVRPNLTQEQADKLAQSLLDDITRHERTISWREPANTTLHARSIVRVEGTTTGFDALYYAESVTRGISFDSGFLMNATAKNHSPAVADATTD